MRRTVPATILIALIAAAILGLALTINSYAVGEWDSGTDVLWSDPEEVYVLANVKRLGWRFSYLRLAWEVLRTAVSGIQPAPTHSADRLLILHVTPDGIERYVVEDLRPLDWTVRDDTLYGWESGRWIRWTGSRFETAEKTVSSSLSERRRAVAGTDASFEFRDLGGWSKRYSVLRRNDQLPIALTLGRQTVELAGVNEGSSEGPQALVLRRQDGQREQLVLISNQPRTVSRAEYEELFP